ncbi:MAG: DUF1289 domain-containing protein [Paracoccaceae bacterium]
MPKPPKPCIGVCKHRLGGGHCIACSMTKAQKKASKRLSKGSERRAFIAFLRAQQAWLGGRFKGWEIAYRRRCAKKGVEPPFDARPEGAPPPSREAA